MKHLLLFPLFVLYIYFLIYLFLREYLRTIENRWKTLSLGYIEVIQPLENENEADLRVRALFNPSPTDN